VKEVRIIGLEGEQLGILPIHEAMKKAEEEGFDLVIMGSSGMGQVSGILLGSVSDRVAHRSTVPVLIVRR